MSEHFFTVSDQTYLCLDTMSFHFCLFISNSDNYRVLPMICIYGSYKITSCVYSFLNLLMKKQKRQH